MGMETSDASQLSVYGYDTHSLIVPVIGGIVLRKAGIVVKLGRLRAEIYMRCIDCDALP